MVGTLTFLLSVPAKKEWVHFPTSDYNENKLGLGYMFLHTTVCYSCVL